MTAAQGGTVRSRHVAQQRGTALNRPAQQGFTLLEMLVALAIFSLAGLALVRLQAFSARSAIDLRERTMSEVVARNLMVERLTDPNPPSSGSTNGTVSNAGRTWTWTQGVAPLQDPRLLGITIRVNGAPGTSPAVISFVRPART
jgi:general secretion pathway protein I